MSRYDRIADDYDADLQQFRQLPPPIDTHRLRFLRWLAERGELEHPAFSRSRGDFVITVWCMAMSGKRYAY